jgi:cold shock protein
LTAVKARKMAHGVVVGFKDDRGFGFIRPDEGGGDVFVHARDIANADKLNQGQRVSFEIVMDDRRGKPRADRVRVI